MNVMMMREMRVAVAQNVVKIDPSKQAFTITI